MEILARCLRPDYKSQKSVWTIGADDAELFSAYKINQGVVLVFYCWFIQIEPRKSHNLQLH